MGVLMGDFIGFQLGEYHSSELGIVRTSDGSRYTEDLSPNLTDVTVPRPGSDGTYFFNSYYTQKPIIIPFAFGSLTELQLRKLRQVFNTKEPQKLIYDESPYKYYLVKISQPPNIKYLCFDEGGQRIYKGEGTLTLVAYEPYAFSTHKWTSDFLEGKPYIGEVKYYSYLSQENNDGREAHLSEWNNAIGLIHQEYSDDNKDTPKYDYMYKNSESSTNVLYFQLNNPGDLEADFILKIPFYNGEGYIGEYELDGLNAKGVKLEIADYPDYQIAFECFKKQGRDDGILYDTARNLFEGYIEDNGKIIRTGNIYNNYKLAGNFFKIPVNKYDENGKPVRPKLNIYGMLRGDADNVNRITIEYSYLYY